MSPNLFKEIARLPLPGDNVAITTRRLEAGTVIAYADTVFALDHTVLEGHRFAVEPIASGAPLLSWNLPFGYALEQIEPGMYVANSAMLEALRNRRVVMDLPARANFEDRITPFILDAASFRPAEQVEHHRQMGTFLGYPRGSGRGVGTRNTIVLLGTTSRTGSFVKQLEAQLHAAVQEYDSVDAIVAVAHTEGADELLNNRELLLRTLAGFMVHPNVGAVLAVDYGMETLTNDDLRRYLIEHNYPIDDLPHHFHSLTRGFEQELDEATQRVLAWLPQVNATRRTDTSLAHLKIALQCGGSDAFSGVSGNPLASWVAREVIRYGGAANLAETDELIGAESYVLQKVRDLATAERFLTMVERFKSRAARHGASAEGNPSGGNKFRGLYNITLKSIGAAMKRHPDVRLDYAIEYGAPMRAPGYYFMDSPGNDLESIAGQVAAGCNLIFFVTGNGSITNFPFVPTIKIVTTSERFALLRDDMDVNAGAYLDGTSMDELGTAMLARTIDVASGQRSVGERAGHAQVQLWRNWRQTAPSLDPSIEQVSVLAAKGHTIQASVETDARLARIRVPAKASARGSRENTIHVGRSVGLILPTSLCAGQIAEMAATRLNERAADEQMRYVALVHTEGCGASPAAKDMATHTMLGYLDHPAVTHSLLLEHGCEITHNDHMHHALAARGLDPERFGWASIQLDGGIAAVLQKIHAWFDEQAAQQPAGATLTVPLLTRTLALHSVGKVSEPVVGLLAHLTAQVVAAGGTVIVPDHAALLDLAAYRDGLQVTGLTRPTLGYGEQAKHPGLHVMATPGSHWVETLVGLGASGAEAVLAFSNGEALQGHPLLPVLQVRSEDNGVGNGSADADLILATEPASWASTLGERTAAALAGLYEPVANRQGNVAFQITRGLLGISM